MYIESGKVKFYPSAYRQYQDGVETKNINPESELNTEYNITSHIAKLLKKSKGSFIVNYVENNNLEFYLGGYYIHITSPQDILNAFPNSTQIWANMKVTPFTPTDNTKGFSELYEVVDYEDNNKNIDEIDNNVVSFKGVAFLATKDSNATFSLQLFTRKDTSSSWYTHTSSEYILDTSEIYNEDGDTDISSEFYSLRIKTDDLYAELGKMNYATINNTLTVDGTTTFNKQVDFKGNLVPINNNQVNIGSSDKEFANIYANNLTATTIKLKSSLIPDGTVTLGLENNPITNIYATNIYGTNLKNVNAIDGGQSSITLKSDIYPDGQVNLGGSTSKFNQIYANETISGGLDALSLKVNDINSGSSFISLYKPILPTSTGTISLGNNNLKFGGIYAITFYGALTGNASTATKLNGNNVGGTKNPVYFSNGVPTKSLYDDTLYDRIERESTFQNVVTFNPNSKAFEVEIPSATSRNKVYINMFALIDFNGDKCSINFVANSINSSSSYNYTNHIVAYNVVYRLLIYGFQVTGSGIRYTMALQYNNNKSASDSASGWTNVNTEYVQSIVVHYSIR